ncbi:MAG TPA: peptide chain release factor N(5)-glutamine methyltransferase [Fimbriimonadales bacterium]|nr:peptide chain release factor N(5)-glutamine methyltransferase [Fimbriimonadales bacterium]
MRTSIRDWLQNAERELREAGFESSSLEAQLLLAHALGVEREKLFPIEDEIFDSSQADSLLARRLKGEPIAYILGYKEFYGRRFFVNRHVLIPRPESEILVQCALEILRSGMCAADIGTGSGNLAITLALEKPSVYWIATDISEQALRVAKENASRFSVKMQFLLADLLSAFRERSLDVIVSNPPYVSFDDPLLEQGVRNWEPSVALFAERGISKIERLIKDASRVLKPGGALLFEFGMRQLDAIRKLIPEHFHVRIEQDLSGIPRVACLHFRE